MNSSLKQELLRAIPSISDLLETPAAAKWLTDYPRSLVTDCLRNTVDELRRQILADEGGRCGSMHVSQDYIISLVEKELQKRSEPQVRRAINAAGIILHTALGRAIWPECVVDAMADDLKGYVTLAVDRESGKRSERDNRVEGIITELTGAEASAVVNNNAAATLIVLAALAAGQEVIVSRGQLIEIGGAFRLPDVMVQSRATLVEVGTTNRTHLRDYANAITENTGALMRVHPSNFRVVGFTKEVEIGELAQLGKSRGITVIDDLGAGALVSLERFGLPHEPTVQDSLAAGADLALFSGDKLIGGPQCGIIVGRRDLIDRIRQHPLARAMRVDKTCLMALERTLQLFRDPDFLADKHPLYRMLALTPEQLAMRAEQLAAEILLTEAPGLLATAGDGVGYLGSGSVPMEQMQTSVVRLSVESMKASALAERLRMDDACIFTRIDDNDVVFDVRTISDEQIPQIAAAVARVTKQAADGE